MSVANHLASLPSDTSPVPDLATLSAALSAQPLSLPRLAWYSTRLGEFLAELVELFPPTAISRLSSSYSPRISVRRQIVPPQHYSWPWLTTENRVRQFETETKTVVEKVNERFARGRGQDLDPVREGDASGRRTSDEKQRKGHQMGGEAVRYNPWAEIVELAEGNGEWLDHVHRTSDLRRLTQVNTQPLNLIFCGLSY